ncbi:MAG: hypothetical protein M0P13_05310 [Fibrobacteraceae bacterium]|nr:hypothetical protein [Fibrobacteraceae bacterium]
MKKLGLVFGVLGISCAFADPLPTHAGLYLDGGAGFDYSESKGELGSKYDGISADANGPDLQFSIKAGYSFIENLAVFANAAYIYFPSGHSQQVGNSSVSVESDGNIGPLFLGGGFAYWLMPVNIYASAAIGTAKFTYDKPYTQDFGFAWRASIGKDWWIGDNGLALGAEAVYMYASVDSGEKSWKSNSLGVLFHFSYN